MMRPPNELTAVYVCIEPVDFRKQINGLAALVQEELELDPFGSSCLCSLMRGVTAARYCTGSVRGLCCGKSGSNASDFTGRGQAKD